MKTPNLLEPAADRGSLHLFIRLRDTATARITPDGPPRARTTKLSFVLPALQVDEKRGLVQAVYNYRNDVAIALWFDRSELIPSPVDKACVSAKDSRDELCRLTVISGEKLVSVDLDTWDAGALRIPVELDHRMKFFGEYHREELSVVFPLLQWAEGATPTHKFVGPTPILEAPFDEADVVAKARLSSRVSIVARSDDGWVEVIAFADGAAAHGYVPELQLEPSKGAGLDESGRGSIAIAGDLVFVPPDTPLYKEIDGALIGRSHDRASLYVVMREARRRRSR